MSDGDYGRREREFRSSKGDKPLLGRNPPQNLEAEQGVLGSILLFNEYLDEVADIITADHFYLDAHQRIYRAILRLHEAKVHAFDAVTVAEALSRSDELKEIGGADYLAAVIGSVPHAAHAKYYAGIVREKAMQRQLIGVCNDVLRECYDEGLETTDVLAHAEEGIFRILESQALASKLDLKDILVETWDRIYKRIEQGGQISGITTGFRDLDLKTNGLQPTELIILAARPSMGKTALVCNVAEAAAERDRKGVLLFSLEQSKLELAERLLCIRGRQQVQKIRKGDLTDEDRDMLMAAAGELSELPLYIDDQAGRTVAQIGAISRRLKRRNGVGMVIIDYLQLIEPEDKRAPREQQIAQITRRLKFLAKELEVPVVALSQLNRAVDARPDKRPRLSDLRESGAIEQDADIVMFLHRPDVYDPEDRPNEAEVIVAKHRSGPTGTVTLLFNKESMRFENFSNLLEPEGGFTFGETRVEF
jgi:replicative DNA helicase